MYTSITSDHGKRPSKTGQKVFGEPRSKKYKENIKTTEKAESIIKITANSLLK